MIRTQVQEGESVAPDRGGHTICKKCVFAQKNNYLLDTSQVRKRTAGPTGCCLRQFVLISG